MVHLLELPKEIFEMIIQRACSEMPFIVSRETRLLHTEQEESELLACLALRLVHSRFREAADPHIFNAFTCVVGSPRFSGPNELLKQENIVKHVRDVQLEIKETDIAIDGSIAIKTGRILQLCAPQLRQLYLSTNEESRISRFYAPTIALDFPFLTTVDIQTGSFALYIPSLLKTAPCLKEVSLEAGQAGHVTWEEMERFIGEASETWGDWVPQRALPKFRSRGSNRWSLCLLDHLLASGLSITSFTLEAKYYARMDQTWRGLPFEILRLLGRSNNCRSFTLKPRMAPFPVPSSMPRLEYLSYILGSESTIRDTRRLFHTLKEDWGDRGIAIRVTVPKEDRDKLIDEGSIRCLDDMVEEWVAVS